MRLVPLLAAVAMPTALGCTVPLPPIEIDAGRDAGMAELDAALPDAPDDAGGTPDTPSVVDAPVVGDAGTDAPDAPPDAGPSCTSRYGGLPEFRLCVETATTCEFYVRTAGDCMDVCAPRGGTCIEAFNDSAMTCTRLDPTDCDTASLLQQICICTR